MSVMRQIGRCTLLAVVLSVAVVWLSGTSAPARDEAAKNAKYPQQIFIIRHAEKTGEKSDIHLSKQGQERADVLYKLFVASKERPDPFPTPDFIFAASHDKSSHRPIETVTPLAMKLKLTIADTFTSKLAAEPNAGDDKEKAEKAPGMLGLRDQVFGEKKYFGKTILVAWRHGTIPELAKTLKASKVPAKWEDEVFDRVWQITYDDQGAATFVDRPQRLLPGDAEK
jgi:hypothetical protein